MNSTKLLKSPAQDRFDRIRDSIDVDRLRSRHTVVIGSANDLASTLCRSGLGRLTAIDFDTVSELNIARQDFGVDDIGRPKVDALRKQIERVNPQTRVLTVERDVTTLSDDVVQSTFGDADLIVCAVDRFDAHKWTNEVSLRLAIPAMFISLYAGGRAAEIVHQVPGTACYRCVCKRRYAFFEGKADTATPSAGGTIHDIRILDAIAAQIAIGILTQGADNRFGRLIEAMGNRTITLTKIDPDYTLNGRDLFRDHLGERPANFCWTPVCLPMSIEHDCPDCGGKGFGGCR